MKRAATVCAAVTFLLALPTLSRAQNAITMRGFADAGLTVFTATQSFDAVLGSAAGPVFGGGLEVGLTRSVFVSVAASRFRRTGQRVFVFQSQVFKLNVSDTISVTPLQVNAGYRFHGRRPRRVVPYVGGGIGWYRFAETSAHSTSADDAKTTNAGYHLLAGAETPIRRWAAAAVDAQWAAVPHSLGESTTSVANLYGEHDLGGFTLRFRIIVGQ
jgi:hypothetical protein